MTFTAEQIAAFAGGTVDGDKNAAVSTFAKIEEGTEGALSFLANLKYEEYIYNTRSSVVLVARDFQPKQPIGATLVRVDNPYECVARLLQLYESMQQKPEGISSLASVDPTARLGEHCYVAPFVCIEAGAEIGDGVVLHPHVTIGRGAKVGNATVVYANATVYHDCRIGQRCVLHAGCVVGADGFGFAPTPEGYEKIPQIGIVVVEDDVEIGANTCIDRSTMGQTTVHRGVKLDNLVQIAHNVEVGSHTVMSSQVGVAGSAKVGEWCMFGGQVGVAGHIKVGDRTQVGAQSGIAGGNLAAKGNVQLMGSPAIDHRQWARMMAAQKMLPELMKEVAQLKKQLEELKR